MRILIATDAWLPQVNGVVRTLERTCSTLEARGHEVALLGPHRFLTLPCPTYPQIRLAWNLWTAGPRVEAFAPEAIHLATEGPVGVAVRAWCRLHRFPFSSSFTTRFPEYLDARLGRGSDLFYAYLRWFHAPSEALMVASPSLAEELSHRGFDNLRPWGRGVDTELFRPRPKADLGPGARPLHLYVGRVAVEKNLPAFLDLDLPGSKWVVGDGPDLEALRGRYPRVAFWGARRGEELARLYAQADCFVFPSRTDTFGIVMLEALASGVPVAAYPVTGPLDVVNQGVTGWLEDDLGRACRKARELDPLACRKAALDRSWDRSADQFLANLRPRRRDRRAA